MSLTKFLSTYPVRGTTLLSGYNISQIVISIHVPRAGYDRDGAIGDLEDEVFLSTYPVRGTT